MKKQWAALLCCMLLVCQMLMPSAGAAGTVYFMAAGEYVLPLADDTMPFWYNGYLYVAGSVFTGTARDSLNVSRGYDKNADAVVLYRSEKEALVFELSKNHAWDANNKVYYPGAIRRNGMEFVPAALVADYFGLQYSYTAVKNGYLVWLRRPDALQLPENVFADAATIAMEERYSEYQKSKGNTVETDAPNEPGAVITGKAVYLCLKAGDNAKALLDGLARYHAQAAFYCDLDFLEKQGGLLRRMTATGHSVGLLLDAQHPELSLQEQAERANALLEQATCGRTRLIRIEDGSEQDAEAMTAAGYCCLVEDLDRSGYALQTTSHAENLQKKIAARSGSSIVWLEEAAGPAGLQAFLKIAAAEDGKCLALTETV